MKTIFIKYPKRILALLLVSILYNCSLDEEVYTFINKDDFFSNGEEATAGVYGLYSSLNTIALSTIYLGDIPTHIGDSDASGGGDWELFERFRFDSFSGTIDGLWNNGYQIINRSNGFLNRLEEVEDIDEDLRMELIAEAKFIRAVTYFTLVRTFKNIIVSTKETTDLSELSASNEGNEGEVYNLIIQDLMDAEQDLPDTSNTAGKGRATSWAAKALLTKVYLQASGLGIADHYASAVTKAEEIINSNQFQLWNGNYEDIFLIQNENKPDYGSIFEFQFTGGINNNNLWGASGGIGNSGTVYDGFRNIVGDDNFYNSWDTSDGRFEGTWNTLAIVNGDSIKYPSSIFPKPAIRKYKNGFSQAVPERLGANIKVLRYADVLLMHSEAINESSGTTVDSYTGVNLVRARAGLAPLSGLTQQQLRDSIRRERELEFCFEGHTLFDLQRYGVDIFLEKVRVKYPEVDGHFLFMPIPQIEIDNNTLIKQNEGYN